MPRPRKVKQQKIKKILKFLDKYLIYFLILLFGFLYSFVAITKYNHYQTGLDLAIYVQTMWFYTHFKLPFVTLYPTYGDLVWADHFSPSFVLLTPFYFLWRDPRTLLILQSFIFVSGAYPIYRYAKEKLKHPVLPYAFVLSFLTFLGVQFPLTFDFHLATMAASCMGWILWFMFTKKWKSFVILSIIASGFKEDMALYIVAISFYLIISRRNWKLGVPMFIGSFGYVILVTKFLMPSFSHVAAKTFSVSNYSLSPLSLWAVFFDSPVKIHTLLLTFGYMFFLPLLSGFFVIVPIAHFFINFSNPAFPGRWGIYLHYRGYFSSILMFSSIRSYMFLMRKKPKIFKTNFAKYVFSALILFNVLSFDYALHLPLNELLKPQFYYTESWIKDNDEVLKHVPPDGYLLTMNHMASKASYRQNISYMPLNIKKADYILADTRPIQPPIDYWLSAENAQDFDKLIESLGKSDEFKIFYQSHDAVLLKRIKNFYHEATQSAHTTSPVSGQSE